MKNFRMCHCETLWVVAISLLLMSGCSIYDNYDIDLMDGAASIDSSSNKEGSSDSGTNSSNGKDTSYVVIINQNSSSSGKSVVSSSSKNSDWTCGESTLKFGDYEYKTVIINGQCWTQENMRFVADDGHSICYDNDESNCDKYGRLYDYKAADVVCPSGWRLPTTEDYIGLQEYSGADKDDAGYHFKAQSGWKTESGDDFVEFSALPGGDCDYEEDCLSVGVIGLWWTSTVKQKNASHNTMRLSGSNSVFNAEYAYEDDNYASVRCVMK